MHARRVLLALLAAIGFSVVAATAGAASRSTGPTTRTWHVSLKGPAQFNLEFAELRFAGRGAASLKLSLTKPAGLYYVAGARVRRSSSGEPRALVVVVNRRPRGSLAADRTTIGLRVTGAASLGAPERTQLTNPFPGTVGSTGPGHLCGLGRNHGAAYLSKLLGPSRSLGGFAATTVVAEAYDVACGLPYDPAFGRAVTGCPTTLVAGCCPANAQCVAPPTPTPTPPPTPTPTPTPTPPPTPIPSPPVCGCQPPPTCGIGYACPLDAAREAMRVIACPLGAAPSIAC
jgi:hypothetical protein